MPLHASAHSQEGGGDGSLTEGGLPLHASAHGQDGSGGGTLTEGGLPLHACGRLWVRPPRVAFSEL